MLVHSNASSIPTPDSSTSTSTTLEPVSTSTNSSSQLHHQLQPSSLSPEHRQQQMSCTSTLNFRPPSRAPSILDSPTLARVERARLRLEASAQHRQSLNNSCGNIANALNVKDNLERVVLDQNKPSLLAGRTPVCTMTGPIKRGLLWQQRDRIFSRWKERYFVLTRDYLHCFKRASGSANERASDMGQFIFKVKLVDVEKVEWLNRRSYSAIGLLLGREGRVLLRCDEGLEDWFELLEECTITSKERRKALKIAQGPRSRASLAAPISHASLQSNYFGLGGTYLSALDDWIMADGNGIGGCRTQKFVTNSVCGYGRTNPFAFSDSVPDLSAVNNENHNHISGMSTNHSTPQKIPYSSSVNNSRYSNGYASQNSSYTNGNGFYGSPQRVFINRSFGSTHIVDEETEDGAVELRRERIFRHLGSENGNELDQDWLYRKPKAPTDIRHSVQPMLPISKNNASFNKVTSHLDSTANDSGLDTPSSTYRPSSYREQLPSNHNPINHPQSLLKGSTETSASSLRGTILNSPACSFKANLNQDNGHCGNRYSIQERILKIHNKEDLCSSIKSANHLNQSELYDPNRNRYNKNDRQSSLIITPQQTPPKLQQLHSQHNLPIKTNSNNNNNNNNNNSMDNGSAIPYERYQHPALKAIINETQGIKYRERAYSDCLQMPSRRGENNNLSPQSNRKNHVNPLFGTPTRV